MLLENKVALITGAGNGIGMTESIPEKVMEHLMKGIPFGRLAEPEEIAAIHAFLSSKEADFIAGQIIFVDGGTSVGP